MYQTPYISILGDFYFFVDYEQIIIFIKNLILIQIYYIRMTSLEYKLPISSLVALNRCLPFLSELNQSAVIRIYFPLLEAYQLN